MENEQESEMEALSGWTSAWMVGSFYNKHVYPCVSSAGFQERLRNLHDSRRQSLSPGPYSLSH